MGNYQRVKFGMKTYFKSLFVIVLSVFVVACGDRNIPTELNTTNSDQNKTLTSPPSPRGTNTPTATSTTRPTSVLRHTSLPTITQRPTKIPIAEPLNEFLPEDLPEGISSDLVWIEDGSLLRWDTKKNEIINWAGMETESVVQIDNKVIHYQLYLGDELIVALDDGSIGTIDQTNLEFQLKTSVEYQFDYPSYKVSPDGQWLAYATIEEGSDLIALYGYYLLNLQNAGRPTLLGSCVLHPWTWEGWCVPNFVWTDDSSTLTWNGYDGLWTVKPDNDPIFITQHQPWPDLGFYYKFVPQEWSPKGRYLYALRTGFDGYLVFLIDTETGRTQWIPEAWAGWGVESSYQLTWLDDGRLLEIFNPHYDWAEHEIIIYQMVPSGEEILRQQREAILPMMLGTVETNSEIVESIKLRDNKIIMITDDVIYQRGANLSLRELSLSNLSLSKAKPLITWEDEGYTESVYWTNDGNWVFWGNISDGHVAIISVSSGEVIQLDDLFGESSCCFSLLEHDE